MPLFPANPLPVAQGGTGATTATGTGNPVLATAPTITSPLIVNGANGNLEIECATDGGDLNIFSSNGNQTLAFYGSGGNTLNLNLLDGSLSVGSTTRITNAGVFFPVQAATASAPAYVKGGIYFDTTLNKLQIGGAAAWETCTSA